MRRSHADIAVTAVVTAGYFGAAMLGAPAAVLAVLGLMLAACPGYVWAEVLLSPYVTGLERIAVAAGLALAVPVLGGLALAAAGIPLHRTAWAALFGGAALVGDAVLLGLRRAGRRVPPGWRQRGPRLAVRHTVALGAALVIAAGTVVLAVTGAVRQQYPGFTQLWLLAQGPHASLGVSNHQGTTTRYRLVLLRKARVSASWNLTLANGQRWQRVIPVGGTGTVAARLYRMPDLTHPYRYVSMADRSPGP